MNYASVVFAGFSTIAGVWYLVYARKHYKGPVLSVVKGKDPREGEVDVVGNGHSI